jgi:hypothetical protein
MKKAILGLLTVMAMYGATGLESTQPGTYNVDSHGHVTIGRRMGISRSSRFSRSDFRSYSRYNSQSGRRGR